jgi:hypothetical protein
LALLRAGNVKPAEMAVAWNSFVIVSPQQPNHMNATTEDLLEVVFSVPSASGARKGVFYALQSKAISCGLTGQVNQSGDGRC